MHVISSEGWDGRPVQEEAQSVRLACRALQLLEQESDPAVQDALRVQMMEFGRTPQQLFTSRHPKRRVLATGARPRICCFPPGPPKRPPPRPPANLLRPAHQVCRSQQFEIPSLRTPIPCRDRRQQRSMAAA